MERIQHESTTLKAKPTFYACLVTRCTREVEILNKRLTSTVNPDNVENMKFVTAYRGANLTIGRTENLLRSLKDTSAEKNIGENTHCQSNIQMFIMFSAIFFLKPGFHSNISLVVGEISVNENQKNYSCPKCFHLIDQ